MDIEKEIGLIKDRQEIEDVVRLYCRALDRLDVELLKSVYHEDGIDCHGIFEGKAHDFAEYIIGNLRDTTTYGMHTITQSIIEIDGNQAACESMYIGYHRIAGDVEKLTNFFGERYTENASKQGRIDVEHEYECGGRYLDRFEKRDGVWRILRRRITNEWGRCKVVSNVLDQGQLKNLNLPGARDRSDPVYENSIHRPKILG